jgi:hypothetical protein
VAEGSATSALLERAEGDWSIFTELTGLQEARRRRILRPHREIAADKGEEDGYRRDLRDRLDKALDRVMLLELGNEAGLLDVSRLTSIPGLMKLFESPAFAKYLSSYLFVPVRFAAGRLVDAGALPANTGLADPLTNDLPVAWAAPPPMEVQADNPDAHIAEQVQAYLQSRQLIGHWTDIESALLFLDGFYENERSDEPTRYRLWLRGLNEDEETSLRFEKLTRGLRRFAQMKASFYIALENSAAAASGAGSDCRIRWSERGEVRGSWAALHPMTARFGCVDFYWLAQLLRADVREDGTVSYADGSWLQLIIARDQLIPQDAHAGDGIDVDWQARPSLEWVDEVLHGVFDFASDLAQNSYAIACERFAVRMSPDDPPKLPPQTSRWREVYDEELEEIARQRQERNLDDEMHFRRRAGLEPEGDHVGWRRRVRTGEHLDDLVGLAFSGGGIRSATFNLGVLQRLQELDLLRHVDYLSTVSGGGYIGAWLLGNVRRTKYWLGKQTNWEESIVHLRRYSNYLAPRTGLMSADTWTMWGSWSRNAFLIQLSAAFWLAATFLCTRWLKVVFYDGSNGGWLASLPGGAVTAALWAVVAGSVAYNIRKVSGTDREKTVLRFAVFPAWVAAFLTSVLMWSDSHWHTSYRDLVFGEWLFPNAGSEGSAANLADAFTSLGSRWKVVIPVFAAGFFGLSLLSIDDLKRRWPLAFLPAVVCTAAVCAGWSGIMYLFQQFLGWQGQGWFAYVFGGPLVLLVMTLGVVLMIGLVGPASGDWRREWWTRFGAWMGIFGIGFLGIGTVGVLAPWFTLFLLQYHWHIAWGSAVAWVVSVVGGLVSGNSSKTNGDGRGGFTEKAVSAIAKAAAFVFILGASMATATLLHLILAYVAGGELNPFGGEGSSLPFLQYWSTMAQYSAWKYFIAVVVVAATAGLLSWRFDINIFGLNQFYQNRLVRCYLGGTRWRAGLRKPHLFTGFDGRDDFPLHTLRHSDAENSIPFRGPFPIVNCSLNLGGSSDLSLHTRHSASFVLTPLRAGADRPLVGYARACPPEQMPPDKKKPAIYANGVTLGQAISVSGAAASPNMGHNSSPLVAVLLTLFNVRLAWWFPNPGKGLWYKSSLRLSMLYLLNELFASADERDAFVNVSDGGHFENLGVYELVRRRCKVIIACDAECDSELAFGSLGNVVRMCATDFNARIEIDVESIRRQKESRLSGAHCAIGTITYANGSRGYLIYLKASMTGDEDVSVEQYSAAHGLFPHESTGDQFFSEDQFESYRRLGHHITAMTFQGVEHYDHLVTMAGRLKDLWVPRSVTHDSFVAQATALEDIWERFRGAKSLALLLRELTQDGPFPLHVPNNDELCVCLELLQLMENSFIVLRLDEFWTHPDNRGWAILFIRWARSPTLRAAWKRYRHTFGIRFEYFCQQRLGLESDKEAVRV